MSYLSTPLTLTSLVIEEGDEADPFQNDEVRAYELRRDELRRRLGIE